MCGIVGYIGEKPAVSFLLDGLTRLEYRGYDSAGVALLIDRKIGLRTEICKSAGKLTSLRGKITEELRGANIGIGHTRWATHGRPSDANAHPHSDCSGRFTVVHNGIIENYASLREDLTRQGHRFQSETDTEVVAHLLEHFYEGDLEEALRRTLGRIRGSFALGVISEEEPDKILAARQDSPLIIGLSQGENFIASDIPAVLPYTRDIFIMEDGEIATLTSDRVEVKTRYGDPIDKKVFTVNWDAEAAEKGGYDHFMLKEIHEQPKALRDTMSGRIAPDGSVVCFEEIGLTPKMIREFNKVAIVGCGTAAHAGLVGKYLIEKWVRLPVEWDIASEFRYRDPIIDQKTLTIVVSQSGETADTLAALREAKRRGSRVVAITNVVGSSISREASDTIYTWAGPEIAVASTKAYTTQLAAITLFALYLAQERGTLPQDKIRHLLGEMRTLPRKAEQCLKQAPAVERLAQELSTSEDFFFIGRGLDYAVAMEGSLKLKEISYIHAEAYAAGELKHGTLALITKDVPVVALVTQTDVYEKTVSNITEVKARDARVIGLAFEGDKEIERLSAPTDVLRIPRTEPDLAPILAVLPLQMLAYYASVARGCDVDKPRNLAKSVTVE